MATKTKKYQLNNSYFKIARNSYGRMETDMLEILKTYQQTGELPFLYNGNNWLYDAFVEKQKRENVFADQFFTPDATANKLAEIAHIYFENKPFTDACCGFGQLTKAMIGIGYPNKKIQSFDIDTTLIQMCKLLGYNTIYSDFRDYTPATPYMVSNPPFSHLPEFLQWAEKHFKISVLILPLGYVDKERPKQLAETLNKFEVISRHAVPEPFVHTKTACEIVVLLNHHRV